MNVDLLWQTLEAGDPLSPEQGLFIFSEAFAPHRERLRAMADAVRERVLGGQVFLRGIVEFSNICRCHCHYCGISAHNPEVRRYRMSDEEILRTIERAFGMGYRSFVLQSGEDPAFGAVEICRVVGKIKERFDAAVTLSIGEWTRDEYAAFRSAGADRFLLRIETADPELYARFHPHSTWERRHRCLMDLKELGFQVGSGILVGLPGQDGDSLRRDLEYLWRLEPEMVGIGPFIPHPQTPLGDARGGTIEDCLSFLALLRLYLPDAYLPATTAMGSIDPAGREKALRAGANVLMPNVSPTENREAYQLYPGKICLNDDAGACRGCVERMVQGLGRTLNLGRGDIRRQVSIRTAPTWPGGHVRAS